MRMVYFWKTCLLILVKVTQSIIIIRPTAYVTKKFEKNINRLKIRSRIESLWKTFRAKTYFYLLTCDSFVMSITFYNNIIKTIIIIQFNFFKFFLTWRTVPVTKRSISFGNPLLVWNSTNMWPQPIKRNEIG